MSLVWVEMTSKKQITGMFDQKDLRKTKLPVFSDRSDRLIAKNGCFISLAKMTHQLMPILTVIYEILPFI